MSPSEIPHPQLGSMIEAAEKAAQVKAVSDDMIASVREYLAVADSFTKSIVEYIVRTRDVGLGDIAVDQFAKCAVGRRNDVEMISMIVSIMKRLASKGGGH